MPPPNRDRVKVTFYLSRTGLVAVDERAAAVNWTRSDMLRHMLTYAHQHMPTHQPRKAKR
jgi:hypothetical protein